MPKLKTHSGAGKRFKRTGKGKIKRRRAFKSHIMTGKPSKRARRLRTATFVSKAEKRKIERLIPNS